MKTTITALATILIMSLNSFSQNGFLNRKYTKGFFYEAFHKTKHKQKTVTTTTAKENEKTESVVALNTSSIAEDTANKSIVANETYNAIIKHNTLFVDTNASYTSVNDTKINIVSKNKHAKKDSVFIKQKRGKDAIIIKKNTMPHVAVITTKKNEVKYKKLRNCKKFEKQLKEKPNTSIIVLSILSLVLSIVPVVGIIFSSIIKSYVTKYQYTHPNENVKPFKVMSDVAFYLSIASLILAIIALIVFVVYVIFSFFLEALSILSIFA